MKNVLIFVLVLFGLTATCYASYTASRSYSSSSSFSRSSSSPPRYNPSPRVSAPKTYTQPKPSTTVKARPSVSTPSTAKPVERKYNTSSSMNSSSATSNHNAATAAVVAGTTAALVATSVNAADECDQACQTERLNEEARQETLNKLQAELKQAEVEKAKLDEQLSKQNWKSKTPEERVGDYIKKMWLSPCKDDWMCLNK